MTRRVTVTAVIGTKEKTVDGATWFIRCSKCHTMYRPEEGLSFKTGETYPCWFKPRPITKPERCWHNAPPEVWNGTGWQIEELKS